jgi:drug/metabolite transporter (DMT)-like permease
MLSLPRILLAATFVVCWSSGFVGSLLAGDDAGPAGLLAWRYLLTAALLIPVAAAVRRTRPGPPLPHREIGRQIILGVLAHVVFLGTVFGAAAAGLDTGFTSLVCALQPLLIAAAGSLFWRDTFTPRNAFALVTGLAAVILSVGGLSLQGAPLALLLPVAALLGLSAATLLERAWKPRVSLVDSLTIQVCTGAVCFTAAAAATGGLNIAVNAGTVGALVWLVLMSGIGGYASFTASLRVLGATPTSMLLFLTPPVTSLWAWAMTGAPPSLAQVFGMVLGCVSVVVFVGNGSPATSSGEPASSSHHRSSLS